MHRETRRKEEDDVVAKMVDAYSRVMRGLSSQQVAGLGFLTVFVLMVALQAWSSSTHQQAGIITQFKRKRRRNREEATVAETQGNAFSITLVGEALGGKKEWRTMLQQGTIVKTESEYRVDWEAAHPLRGFTSLGSSMALSSLQSWHNTLYTCDDKTGIVFELSIHTLELYPRHILAGGDGNTERPFKCEWMATKEGRLYIGSIGKEWIENGEVTHGDFQWIKVLPGDRDGRPRSILWEYVYTHVREKLKAARPGYVIHEAVQWSDVHKQWFFLPYRVSREAYDEVTQLSKASNVLVRCGQTMEDCTEVRVGPHSPRLGFVEFKFLPDGTDSIIAAVRSQQHPNGPTLTQNYLVLFRVNGEIIMDDTPIPGYCKYEGLEVQARG
eukprot:TRINITY_DN24155_c0_g1_i1.p1 TRINITY_DN24155_c0_g1~~TRINITY_DN24155_c0_g1_i1.p1  ORF type:complete len:402 (+),score=79.60 TRINITY_DN24155_c0_g1_i1:56-1207(+)